MVTMMVPMMVPLTKEANDKSFVNNHQHGNIDIICANQEKVI
jgi:hypothetical protein